MSDRRDFYNLQPVTEAELDAAFEGLEKADRNLAIDMEMSGVLLPSGVTMANKVLQDTPSPTLHILVQPLAAFDSLGQRCSLDSTRQAYEWRAGESTAITGETGYQKVDIEVDDNGLATDAPTSQERWVSVFLTFDRELSDIRVDGNSNNVYFVRDEFFKFQVLKGDLAGVGLATPPSKPSDSILLVDILREANDTTVDSSDFDFSRSDILRTQAAMDEDKLSRDGSQTWVGGTANPFRPATEGDPIGGEGNRWDLWARHFNIDPLGRVTGDLIPSATFGQRLGDATNYWDARLRNVTFDSTSVLTIPFGATINGDLSPSGSGHSLGVDFPGSRWDAALDDVIVNGKLDLLFAEIRGNYIPEGTGQSIGINGSPLTGWFTDVNHTGDIIPDTASRNLGTALKPYVAYFSSQTWTGNVNVDSLVRIDGDLIPNNVGDALGGAGVGESWDLYAKDVYIEGKVKDHWIPDTASGAKDLGSISDPWDSIHVNNFNLTGNFLPDADGNDLGADGGNHWDLFANDVKVFNELIMDSGAEVVGALIPSTLTDLGADPLANRWNVYASTLDITGVVKGNLNPESHATYDLGFATSGHWKKLYVDELDSNITGLICNQFFIPSANNLDLGSLTNRWKAFLTDVDIDGTITVDGNILPAGVGNDLGNGASAATRWDIFASSLNLDGPAIIDSISILGTIGTDLIPSTSGRNLGVDGGVRWNVFAQNLNAVTGHKVTTEWLVRDPAGLTFLDHAYMDNTPLLNYRPTRDGYLASILVHSSATPTGTATFEIVKNGSIVIGTVNLTGATQVISHFEQGDGASSFVAGDTLQVRVNHNETIDFVVTLDLFI